MFFSDIKGEGPIFIFIFRRTRKNIFRTEMGDVNYAINSTL